MELPYDLAIILLGIHPEKMKTLTQIDIGIPMFITALFTIAMTWKQLKHPLMDKWIKKLWFNIQWNIIQPWIKNLWFYIKWNIIQPRIKKLWFYIQWNIIEP